MTNQPDASDLEHRLSQLIASYLEASEIGAAPDRSVRALIRLMEATSMVGTYKRLIASAVRSASAARVRVGLAVPTVGNSEDPATNRFGTSCERPKLFVTERVGSVPIWVVPIRCPAPNGKSTWVR